MRWRRLRTWLWRLRARFSRGRLIARLLGARPPETRHEAPGLVLVQADGLSRTQFERARAEGRLPFLRHLGAERGYRTLSHYAGLPSTTPAVQAELFYGVRCAVPAFDYIARREGETRTMYEYHAAAAVQRQLERRGHGLLAGGSAHADIYDGGAEEAHVCAARLSVGGMFQGQTVWTWARLLALHSPSLVRVVVLCLVEFALALYDFAAGLRQGRKLWPELKFVPVRTLVSAGLREWTTASAEAGIAQGLPVVHVNYMGYDEQAHRRGPSSAFAHWTLKGIDHSVRRLDHAARHAQARDYQVWVYSDHGQAECKPYLSPDGKPLRAAVEELAARFGFEPEAPQAPPRTEELQRARWLRVSAAPLHALLEAHAAAQQVRVRALGPVAHIYLPRALEDEEAKVFCAALANEYRVPLVLPHPGPHAPVRAWAPDRALTLRQDGEQVLGAAHPFFEPALEDLMRLVRHPDAGHVIALGWCAGSETLAFVDQAGCHGGAHPKEVQGFALLPAGAANGRGWLRPMDLRAAALARLRRNAAGAAAPEGAA